MANTMNLVTKYQPLLDEVYKDASLTQDLENNLVKFDGSHTVKVLKVTVPALGAYSRSSGYTSGDLTAAWETFTLSQDRGREFSIDRMDNEETLDMTVGAAASQFIRTSVVPEVDAYRFATMASTSGISNVSGTLTQSNIIAAIDAAIAKLDEDEVSAMNRILYITPTNYQLLKAALAAVGGLSRVVGVSVDQNFETYDGMKIVKVPKSRFATTFAAATSGGFTLSGNYINFLVVEKSAVEAIAKHAQLKIFAPDDNQDADAWKMQYRIYHDEFVYENKVAGIYLNTGAKIA